MLAGDLVATMTDKMGIHPVGECGCNARRKWMNEHSNAIYGLAVVVILGAAIFVIRSTSWKSRDGI